MQLCHFDKILTTIESHQYIVIDSEILRLYPKVKQAVENSKKYFILNSPESCKSIEKFYEISEFFLTHGISRSDKILAIGGGATSDLAGFVAATILRGVKWEIISTTLLSAIDASIGGKVGINTSAGKNLIGNFHEPENIYFCNDFLRTLEPIELESGKGELLKYCFLSKNVFDEVKNNGYTKTLIKKCADYKIEIVAKDLKEGGLRKLLNLGHTIGHAMEKSNGAPHGINVMFGLQIIIDLYAPHLKNDFTKLKKTLGLENIKPTKSNFQDVISYLKSDKKQTNQSSIDLILPITGGESKIESHLIISIKEKLENYNDYEHFFI